MNFYLRVDFSEKKTCGHVELEYKYSAHSAYNKTKCFLY